MPALAQTYNPTEHEPHAGFEVIPPSRVRAMIMATSIEHVKKDAIIATDGTSNKQQLSLTFEVQGGEFNGQKFWDRIWVLHPEEKAMKFGNSRMSSMCHSAGYLQSLTNSDVLHGRTVEVDLGVEGEGKDPTTGKTYNAKNVVKNYVLPGAAPKQASVGSAPATASAAAKKKPWEK